MSDWRKSSYSQSTGGQCVEVAGDDQAITVRDTTNRDGFTLRVPAPAWSRFLATLR
jgi:hypothetical protein